MGWKNLFKNPQNIKKEVIQLKMNKSLPKILIISEFFFNENTGGGVLLKNLFENYPKNKIFIIHEDINVTDFYKIKSFSLKNKSKLNSIIKLIIPSRFWQLCIFIKNSFFIKKSKGIGSDLLNKLSEFKPDLIYTILGNYELMCLIKEIKLNLKIPMITHIMDNIPANFKNKHCKEYKIFKFFIENSETRIAINSKMAEVFKENFNCDFSTIHNGVDKKKIQYSSKKEDIKVITYIGSVFRNAQLNSLVRIASTIKLITSEKYKIKCVFYFPKIQKEMYESLFPNAENISILTHDLNEQQYFKKISESDLLILASNFDKPSIEYYKYSWPAKMGSYLMSKVPIFIFGPPNVFFVNDAIKRSWAYVESSNSLSNLKKSLSKILNDNSLRKKILKKAKIVSHEFEIKKIRQELIKLIFRTVEK